MPAGSSRFLSCNYSINVLFATHLQVDLKMSPGAIGKSASLQTSLCFRPAWAGDGWPTVGARPRRPSGAASAIPIAPLYSSSGNFTLIWAGLRAEGAFGSGGFASQAPSYLSERCLRRATAAGFCYHQGAIWGGLVAPTGRARRSRTRPVDRRDQPARIAPWW